jgi:CPA2 family monovalent cation:H+ antiporter-2
VHELDLILTLTGGLTAALVLGYATERLGLSPIIGYLLAGMLVGPHTPGFVANYAMAEQLAEVGVILLMFGVGLQLHLDDLIAVRRVAVPGAVGQSAAATVLGALIGHLFGWPWSASIVFGLALAVASTVVLVRVLSDHRDLHTPTGHVAVGWLVVEDLLTVVALVLLPALVGAAETASTLLPALAATAAKIGALIAIAALVGQRLIPRALDRVAATGSRELFTLTTFVVALGVAVASALLFGVSMALGAFVAGLIVGRSEYSVRAASEALPMRDAFAVLFFVSVGMLLDPRAVAQTPGLVLAAFAVVVVAKPLVAFVIVWLLGRPRRVGIAVAIALAQIGEFSFMLSRLGLDLGILPREAANTIVVVSIISIVLNPLLYRTVGSLERWMSKSRRTSAPEDSDQTVHAVDDAVDADPRLRAVVIGYGPTGRTVARLLRENGINPTIVELNIETVRSVQRDGLTAVYGDAMKRETLEAAGVATVRTVVFSTPRVENLADVIRMARDLNPAVQVLARATYLREQPDLFAAGADTVFTAEGEIALAFSIEILRRVGATPEQIDRERTRVRAELIEGTAGRKEAG